jgi:cytochrome c553
VFNPNPRDAMPVQPTRLPLTRMLAVAALCLAAASASAQEIDEKAQLCTACHGEAGIPQEATTPIIWGQHQGYLYFQLRDYKLGYRKNEQKSAIIEGLEREDLLALAEYYSKKQWPRLGAPRAAEDVTRKAMQANSSIGCTGCHLGEYQGGGTVPRLAGQSADYLKKTMDEFRSKARGNNPGMTSLMLATPEDDIDALSRYLAGL